MSYSITAESPSAVPFGTNIRTVVKDGSPAFVLEDVCEALGIADRRAALLGLYDEEHAPAEIQTDAGPRVMETVTESGLYSLALSARSETGESFAAWVGRALAYKTTKLHPVMEFVQSKMASSPERGDAGKEQGHE